jgi:predicted transcriptional regulator/DNA-binding XRE family transcriptional regulator
MPSTARLGPKVRTLRRKERLTQADLARKLGISSSYLNLIEHDRRALTAPLLLKLAQLFRLDLDAFSGDDEARLSADLQEAFGDPLFEEHDLLASDVREIAGNVPAARAVLALYRAYQSARDATRALAERMEEGVEVTGLDPLHLPSEEVSDVIQQNRNHFPRLEEAAGALARDAKLDPADLYPGLVRYSKDALGVEVAIQTVESDPTAVRRYDAAGRRLFLSEVLPPRSRNFQLAHQIGLLSLQSDFDDILRGAHLTTPDSVTLCKVALANYFAGAVLMPYERFRESADAVRYDIELLGHRFRTSFEQVCHRLTTLQRPGNEGVPFHLVRVDIAGNISKRFSASGIRFARFSGSCPRWNVHKAFLTPQTVRTQVSQMPDGTRYFSISRTIRKSRAGYGSPHTLLAIELGCDIRHARRLVYADGVDLDSPEATVPIGVTCRLCERLECGQRAFPSIQHRLSLDENVRSVSFYAPVLPAAGGRPR